MKESLKALTATAATVAVFVLPAVLFSNNTAEADIAVPPVTVTLPVATVTVRVPGPIVPGPTVTLPGNPVTVRVPGPTETVTVRPEAPTATVVIPGPTETVTVQPDNPEPSALPTATVTVTEPAGQTPTTGGTVEPEPTDPEPSDDTQTVETVVKKVVVGLLVTLIIAGIGILALFLGYILGRKDERRQTQGFYRTLLGAARGDRAKE